MELREEEFVLKCNQVRCRADLKVNAVVTTCSHVFCESCAKDTGLSSSTHRSRQCPACGARLPNPHDVTINGVQPTEDYQAIVMSGLHPDIIINCAQRGLSTWAYQASQEMVYLNYIAKGLNGKYMGLRQQVQKYEEEANAKTSRLKTELSALQSKYDKLQSDYDDLDAAFTAKSKGFQRTQSNYQALKARFTGPQTAAAVDEEMETESRGGRFTEPFSNVRIDSTVRSRMDSNFHPGGARQHIREGSGSSGTGGQLGLGAGRRTIFSSQFPPGVQSNHPTPHGTPISPRRIPILGGNNHPNSLASIPQYQSPANRLPVGGTGSLMFGAGNTPRGLGENSYRRQIHR